jgi:hypothetical protein
MRTFTSSLASRAGTLAALVACLAAGATAFNFAPIADPSLSLTDLGRVALAGDFDAISLYQFQGQNENATATSAGSLLTRFPNGVFTALQETDGEIRAMCPFISNGTLQGIVFGGNFTSVGGVAAQGIALLNPDTAKITALPGLKGSVNALLCDKDASRVYVGGTFTGGGAQNAIVWITDWINMPFSGFNGPVKSVVKAANGNVIFGGSFDGLGNTTTPKEKDVQVIPISSANITAVATTTTDGFTDPRNIICKTGSQDGPGNTWLLADNSPGNWVAKFGFGFQPSKLRLYNTVQADRGTKEFRFTALPDGGIMNLTYTNTAGETAYCDSICPLPQGNSTFQDFHFVNIVGMNSFRIDISAWYGKGGGLSGIELFENDIYSFAVNEFNAPSCAGIVMGASASSTGPWTISPSGQSNAQYLTATLPGPNITVDSASVVFKPDIKQSGNYTVTIFTPGCTIDGTCGTRGRVNVTGTMAASTRSGAQPFQASQIFQTNQFDKYDQIFSGYVDANTDAFRPTITLTPVAGQAGPLTVVAQRVRFELNSPTTGGLNGLFEYEADKQVVSDDYSTSAINVAGASLSPNLAPVTTLIVDGNTLYVGGNFTGNGFSNVFSVSDGNATSLPGNGLNSEVMTMYHNGTTLYIGGNFTNTEDGKSTGLNGLAAYSTKDKRFIALGAGVNGVVMYIEPISLNFTDGTTESCLFISGTFDSVFGFGKNATFSVTNSAIWVPSRQNWLHNLDIATISISGVLMAQSEIPGSQPVFSGSISSQALGASGAVQLTSGETLGLQQYPINVRPQTSSVSLRKRATGQETVSGVVTGLIYTESELNITILAGHFAATGSDGSNITNLIFVNGTNSDTVTGMGDGIDSDSVFLSVATYDTTLFAGGQISGKVNDNTVKALVLYDLSTASYVATQPAGLQGTDAAVSAIAPQPDSKDVYIGGNFLSAGALSCPAVCIWNTERSQWVSPGNGLAGNVSSMTWVSSTSLLIGGDLTVGGNATSMVTFNSQNHEFAEFTPASNVPGPVTALCPANNAGSQFWVAGSASDGTAFLDKFDGAKWVPAATSLGKGTTIRGIQVLTTSKDHDKTDLFENDQVLLVLGQINVTGFGKASAVLFNGTTFTPFLLSNTATGAPGSLSQAFVENPLNFFTAKSMCLLLHLEQSLLSSCTNFTPTLPYTPCPTIPALTNPEKHLAVGFVVLIGLAISLMLIFLLVCLGVAVEMLRKKRQGYVPANTQMFDKPSNLNRVPPEHLLGTLNTHDRGPL